MSDATELIIPYAAAAAPACREALRGLSLPSLQALLSRLAPGEPEPGDVESLTPPHERALARALGLPLEDGRTPWAAWQLHEAGRDPGEAAWAWLTPCHWVVGADHIAMAQPEALGLSDDESRVFLEAMRPFFEEDGLGLEWHAAGRWLARGEIFRSLACASLDRAAGRPVDPWLPRSPEARPLRRLQQEMQMLLYTHPANEARERARRQTVNSFWAWGAGALPRPLAARRPAGLQVDERLRAPALAGDGAAWADAWRALDAQVLPALLARAQAGQPVTLTLCGERQARRWGPTPQGWGRRLSGLLRREPLAALFETL